MVMAAGMMAMVRVIRRRSQGRMRMFRKPSITIWPASVPVSVEDCPEQSSAMANRTPANAVPSSGDQQQMRLLDLGDHDAVPEEDRRGEDQDGGIHQQGGIQRHHRIDQIVAAGGALTRIGVADLPGLHQRRMQVEIVRHHRGAQHADGDIQGLAVEAGNHAASASARRSAWPARSRCRNRLPSRRSAPE